MSEQKGNPVVGIAGVIGGISLSIVVVFAIFAEDQLSVAPWIVGALAVMGIVLGFFASKPSKPE
jgi:Zn-dependent protease